MGMGSAPAVEKPDKLLAKLKYAACVDPKGTAPELSDVLGHYDRLRAYVMHEDDLTHSRLTWSLTTQGFLFATFGFVLGKILDFLSQAPKPGAPSLGPMLPYLVGFLAVVACVGMMIGVCSAWAVQASHAAIQALRKIAHFHGPLAIPEGQRQAFPKDALLIPHVIGGGAGWIPTFGGNFQLLLPLLTALAWLAILAILLLLWYNRVQVFGAALTL